MKTLVKDILKLIAARDISVVEKRYHEDETPTETKTLYDYKWNYRKKLYEETIEDENFLEREVVAITPVYDDNAIEIIVYPKELEL